MKAGAVRGWLWAVYFVAGAPGLMAQVAWTRILAAGLGHEFPALTGVIAAYFGGMALGALAVRRGRASGPDAARWYGRLEAGCGLWVCSTIPWLSTGLDSMRTWVGVDASPVGAALVGFGGAFLMIGPATAAMGATLPMMERATRPLEADGRAVSGLYAWNTAGALVGLALAIGVLMPTWGFRATLAVAGGLQILCGGVALGLVRWGGFGPGYVGVTTPGERRRRTGPIERPAWRRWVFASGFLGIGFEVLGVRALAQATENTVRSYGWALGAVLLGTATGAAIHRWLARTGRVPRTSTLLGMMACLGCLSVGAMEWSGRWLDGIGSVWGPLWAEGWVAMCVFVPPAIGMGVVYAGWVQEAGDREGGVGSAVAWNCLGAALAGPVWVGGILPGAGLEGALLLAAGGYLILVPWREWRPRFAIWPLGFGVLAGVFVSSRGFMELPLGATLVRSWDGRMASVSVLRTSDGERVLRVNHHFQQGGTATATAARRQGHLPLLLHPEPKEVLFLGIGTGITMGAAVEHPDLTVEGVELLPEVVRALPEFEPENRSIQARERFRVRVADARRFVRATERFYDVVVADLFHPAEDGAGMLYTREHFEAIRRRLAPGGLFCQWLPLHQLDRESFRDVGTTFLEVFPEASLWLMRFNVDVPVVGLIGSETGTEWNPTELERRLTTQALAAALKPAALTDPVRIWGCRVADRASLLRMVAGGKVATDDWPRVMFGAARAAYLPEVAPHRKLAELLLAGDPGFRECLGAEDFTRWGGRLEAFRSARDRHLIGLGKEVEGRRQEALEDYLASAATTAEYTAGYGQAVLVASAYAREDPDLARSILERLVRIRPEQGLAGQLLERLTKAP